MLVLLGYTGAPERLGLTADDVLTIVGALGMLATQARAQWPRILRGVAAVSRALRGQAPLPSETSTVRLVASESGEPGAAESHEDLPR